MIPLGWMHLGVGMNEAREQNIWKRLDFTQDLFSCTLTEWKKNEKEKCRGVRDNEEDRVPPFAHLNVTNRDENSGITFMEAAQGQPSGLALSAQVVLRQEGGLLPSDAGQQSQPALTSSKARGPLKNKIMQPCLAPLTAPTTLCSIYTAEHKFPLISNFLNLVINRKCIKID